MILQGQVAVVTGGSRGIGRGICLSLAEAGANIVVNYRRDEKAAGEVVNKIQEMGRKALAVMGDVSNFEVAKELMKKAYDAFGRIDILVNNAGIASRGNDVFHTEVTEWNRVLRTNLDGVFNCSKIVLEYMRPQKKGNIINISSVGASTYQPGHSPYAVAKSGVEVLTKILAREEAATGFGLTPSPPALRRVKWVTV